MEQLDTVLGAVNRSLAHAWYLTVALSCTNCRKSPGRMALGEAKAVVKYGWWHKGSVQIVKDRM